MLHQHLCKSHTAVTVKYLATDQYGTFTLKVLSGNGESVDFTTNALFKAFVALAC